jgi:hypothetical protein
MSHIRDSLPSHRPSGWDRLLAFQGKRSLAGLLGMIVLVGMGEHMAERFLPLYLQQLAQGCNLAPASR